MKNIKEKKIKYRRFSVICILTGYFLLFSFVVSVSHAAVELIDSKNLSEWEGMVSWRKISKIID